MTVYLAQGGWVVLDAAGRVVGRGETREAAISKAQRVPPDKRRRLGTGPSPLYHERQKQKLKTKVRVIGFYATKSITKGIR